MRLWRMYERQLEKRPLFTKCWMSGIILGTADVMAQRMQFIHSRQGEKHKESAQDTVLKQEGWFNWRRAASVQMYCFVFQGPFGHLWYPFLDRCVVALTKARPALKIPTKTLLDEVVNGLMSATIYFSFIPIMEGQPLEWVKEKLRWDLLATFFVEIWLWIPANALNFTFVPLRHQLMCCNGILLVWTTFLSIVCHEEAMLRFFDPYNPFLTPEEKQRYAKFGNLGIE